MIFVDARGKRCPLPIIELARAMKAAQPGEEGVLLADDPAAAPDLQAWCRMTGHELISSVGDEHRVKKPA